MGESHYRSAEEAYQRCEYERAASEYTQLILADPHRVEAFSRRADVLKALGRHEAAIADYGVFLAAKPNSPPALFSRGQLLAFTDRHEAAIADFSAVIATAPTHASAYLSRGQSLMRMGRARAAVDDFARALELSPGNALAFLERGSALLQLGETQAAAAEFSRAIQLNPFLWSALARRAETHEKLGRLDSAISDLSEALRLDSTNASLLIARGKLRLRMGFASEAIHDFEEAARHDPGSSAFHATLAEGFSQAGRLDLAEAGFTRALALQSDAPAWWLARGDVRLRSGDYDGALADFTESIHRDPGQARAHFGAAQVYLSRSDAALAAPYLDRALELDSTLTEALVARARFHREVGNDSAALADISRAIELNPDSPAYRLIRVEHLLLVERHEEAAEDLAHVLRHERNDPKVYFLRARLEFARGRVEVAIADLGCALRINPAYTGALVDRALLYRHQRRHREALADLTTAVQQDVSHAAEFLVQTGLVHGAEGQYTQALANFSVALKLDPENRAALRGRQLVSERRDSNGSQESLNVPLSRLAPTDLSRIHEHRESNGKVEPPIDNSPAHDAPAASHPETPVSDAEPEIDLSTELAEESAPAVEDTSFDLAPDLLAQLSESQGESRPTLQILAPPKGFRTNGRAGANGRSTTKLKARVLPKAKPLARAPKATPRSTVRIPEAKGTATTSVVMTAKIPSLADEREVNEREFQAEQQRLADLKRRAEEAKKKSDEEKKAAVKKSQTRVELSEEEEDAQRYKKRQRIKLALSAVVVLAVVLSWTWSSIAAWIPESQPDLKEVDATALVDAHSSNASAFQQKYMGDEQVVIVTGTLKEVRIANAPRYFFDSPGPPERRLEAAFPDLDSIPNLNTPVRLIGKLAKSKTGSHLELRNAVQTTMTGSTE